MKLAHYFVVPTLLNLAGYLYLNYITNAKIRTIKIVSFSEFYFNVSLHAFSFPFLIMNVCILFPWKLLTVKFLFLFLYFCSLIYQLFI
jgi:hypothetical protein